MSVVDEADVILTGSWNLCCIRILNAFSKPPPKPRLIPSRCAFHRECRKIYVFLRMMKIGFVLRVVLSCLEVVADHTYRGIV